MIKRFCNVCDREANPSRGDGDSYTKAVWYRGPYIGENFDVTLTVASRRMPADRKYDFCEECFDEIVAKALTHRIAGEVEAAS